RRVRTRRPAPRLCRPRGASSRTLPTTAGCVAHRERGRRPLPGYMTSVPLAEPQREQLLAQAPETALTRGPDAPPRHPHPPGRRPLPGYMTPVPLAEPQREQLLAQALETALTRGPDAPARHPHPRGEVVVRSGLGPEVERLEQLTTPRAHRRERTPHRLLLLE